MTRTHNGDWNPASWQSKPALQQPVYADQASVEAVIAELSRLPPLVTSFEIEILRHRIAEAQRGERFMLQGGDCAESFSDCRSDKIAKNLKILLQMRLVLLYGLKKPVTLLGRIAGQFAKPRSADTETRDGVTLPSYRGDVVNRPAFSPKARQPDPALLLSGYKHAALTLNFVRSLVDGGFADLHHPEYWNLDFAKDSPQHEQFRNIAQIITESLDTFETITGDAANASGRHDFFTSHEGLLLLYEQAQTRYIERRGHWYNLATHFPWIGMRTAAVDCAHVEYFRGIANPIAIKLGPSMTPEWLQQLIAVLNPGDIPGRITLVHRFGASEIGQRLPPLVDAVRSAGATVLWCCDPMHGNTEVTISGVKTRRFDRILKEVETAFAIHKDLGTRLGGVHCELTGEDVTECTGGARGLTEADLQRAYHSQVDPRLNYEQALELAMRIAGRQA